MTQEQLVDICRLMDINKDGLVDLNEFLESFRLAEKSLHEEDHILAEMKASWQELDRCPSRTAVDKDETEVEIELLKLDDAPDKVRPKSNRAGSRSAINKDESGVDVEVLQLDEDAHRKYSRNGRAHLMGEATNSSRDLEEIELTDCTKARRPGLLESDM